jgi:exopolysaccharide production protein ExoQ
MMGSLGPVAFVTCMAWLLYRDVKDRPPVPASTWVVLAWVVIYSTRPVTSWFGMDQGPRNDDDGNFVEALINLSLIICAVVVLVRRRVSLATVIEENRWLFICYLFWLLSVTWSDYPLITVKRLFKDVGNVAMVLVLLTARDPVEAFRAVAARLAYLCIPLSIVLIRYYPEIGRAYGGYHGNEVMNIGVTTQKNALGALAMVSALVMLWDLLNLRERRHLPRMKATLISRGLVLLMCLYLLRLADSATSLICAVLGVALLIALSMPSMSRRPGLVESYGIGAAAIAALLDWTFRLRAGVVEGLGRDMTLTTRTEVWSVLLELQDSPLIGAGFGTFWAGWRQELVWSRLGVFVQAHNGYLDVYLNGGLVGVVMLALLLAWGYSRIRRALASGARDAGMRLVLLLTAAIHNYAEASFYRLSLLWFLTVFALVQYHSAARREDLQPQRVTAGGRRRRSMVERGRS